MRRLGIVVGMFMISLALVLPSGSASAMHMKSARHAVVGGCIVHTTTHVLSCIKGTYKFQRIIRGHKRVVFGVVLSAQHCKIKGHNRHCWGRVIGGRLRAMNAPGRPVASRNTPPANYCFSEQICTNPFYWLTGVSNGIQDLQDKIVNPCESGGLKGFGGGVLGNLVAKAMLSSGAISEATMVAKFSNPESIAFLSVAGCVGKVASNGTNDVMKFYDRLRNFGSGKRGARHGDR